MHSHTWEYRVKNSHTKLRVLCEFVNEYRICIKNSESEKILSPRKCWAKKVRIPISLCLKNVWSKFCSTYPIPIFILLIQKSNVILWPILQVVGAHLWDFLVVGFFDSCRKGSHWTLPGARTCFGRTCCPSSRQGRWNGSCRTLFPATPPSPSRCSWQTIKSGSYPCKKTLQISIQLIICSFKWKRGWTRRNPPHIETSIGSW